MSQPLTSELESSFTASSPHSTPAVDEQTTRFKFLPELVFHILDQLHDDTAALKCCTYVSHHWRSVAWRHLFSKMVIRRQSQLDGIPALFLQFISANPSVCSYVLELKVMYVTCTAHDLLLVVNKLPRMHTLEVSDLHFPPQPVMDLRGAADANWIVASKALKALRVVSCSHDTMGSVQSFRPFWELINAFSYIEELHVSYVVQVFTRLEDMWTESIADLTTIPLVCNRRTHVERLYICSWTSAMRFASHFLDLTQLSHMEIVPSLSWQDLSGLFSVASHLKHLRMELTDSALSPDTELSYFKACKSLQTLDFTLIRDCDITDLDNLPTYRKLFCAVKVIESLSSSSQLSTIRFNIYMEDSLDSYWSEFLIDTPWSILSLPVSSLRSLKKFTIHILFPQLWSISCPVPETTLQKISETFADLTSVDAEVSWSFYDFDV